MIGQDIQAVLPETPESKIHKSMSVSSATTTDEDFPCWGSSPGSPKQCWADLSEEDDVFMPEWSPLDEAQGGAVESDSRAMPCESKGNVSVAAPDVFTVTLAGIPVKLCNEVCLDAILWAAGVQSSVLNYETKKNGRVSIDFSTLDAAAHCSNHFKTCSWASGKLNVDIALPSTHQTASGYRKGAKGFSGRARGPSKQTKHAFVAQQWW